ECQKCRRVAHSPCWGAAVRAETMALSIPSVSELPRTESYKIPQIAYWLRLLAESIQRASWSLSLGRTSWDGGYDPESNEPWTKVANDPRTGKLLQTGTKPVPDCCPTVALGSIG
ncbi:hypothetical protein ASPTUDRAFT_110649, partial [Aspergillus tubingensis CBS 134.48]